MCVCNFLTNFVAYKWFRTIMTVADYIKLNTDEKRFSFEVLPPLKGNGTEALFKTIDKLAVFNPAFINMSSTTGNMSDSAFVVAQAPSP